MTNDLINTLGLFMTDDLSILMTLSKVAYVQCIVVVCDRYASKKTTAKDDGEKDGKNRTEKKEKQKNKVFSHNL